MILKKGSTISTSTALNPLNLKHNVKAYRARVYPYAPLIFLLGNFVITVLVKIPRCVQFMLKDSEKKVNSKKISKRKFVAIQVLSFLTVLAYLLFILFALTDNFQVVSKGIELGQRT